jgi:hypothetical protein
MPSPIMLPLTPDLHPIRQELLRGLVQAIRRMSKRQCRDMALKIAAHRIHTLVKPRARGGLKPAQRVRRPRCGQRMVRSIFGDRYPLQEIKAWLPRASIRTAIKPTLGRLA